MRTYFDTKEQELERVVCNQCLKRLKVEDGMLKEGCYEGNQKFGYFSKKDGEEHSFDLCEDCYNKWILGFQLEIQKLNVVELL